MIKYFKSHFHRILICILMSFIFAFLVFPQLSIFISTKKFIEIIFLTNSIEIYLGYTSLFLLVLIVTWGKVNNIIVRWINNFQLEFPPFTCVDYITWSIIFSFFWIFLFQSEHLPDFSKYNPLFFLYLDFFVFWLVLSFNKWDKFCWFFAKKTKQLNRKNIIQIELDNPIDNEKDDSLGRDNFIEGLYRTIINNQFDKSFVYGLYGGWGEGKTSVINLLRNKIDRINSFIVVNFNPWNYKDENAIITGFYREIEKSINYEFILPDLNNKFKEYSRLVSAGISHLGMSFNFSYQEDKNKTYETIKKEINSIIERLNKKILVIIDDIDRLSFFEILLVFKLVRNNTDFKNSIFLLSFDPLEIEKRFKKNEEYSIDFLEKIINIPVKLPAIESYSLKSYLFDNINNLLNKLEINENDKKIFFEYYSLIYDKELQKIITNLRDAKRYLNSAINTIPSIIKEVNLIDVFLIEIIKVFNQRIYDDIWQNKWYYLPIELSNVPHEFTPFLQPDAQNKSSYIDRHIRSLFQENIDIIQEPFAVLLGTLFDDVNETFNEDLRIPLDRPKIKDNVESTFLDKRISHPKCFEKYFIYKIPILEFSQNYMNNLINEWITLKSDNRIKLISKKINDIKNSTKIFNFIDLFELYFDNNVNDKQKIEIATDFTEVIINNIDTFSEQKRNVII